MLNTIDVVIIMLHVETELCHNRIRALSKHCVIQNAHSRLAVGTGILRDAKGQNRTKV